MRNNRNDKLLRPISIFISLVYILLAVFTVGLEVNHINKTYVDELTNIVKIIASDDRIIEKIETQNHDLESIPEDYMTNVPDLSSVIIIDINNNIYAHPDNSNIGETYSGSEYITNEGLKIIKTNMDDEGPYKTAVYPITKDGETIGYSSISILQSDIRETVTDKSVMIVIGFTIGYIATVIGFLWLKKIFKGDILGFCPAEIAMLYAENKSIIEQFNEAVISVDRNLNITTINEKLMRMFKISQDNIGKNIDDVFPYIDFEEIINKDVHKTNKYKKILNQKLLINAFPLYLDDEIIGATAIMRSHLEVDTLVDQISGYQQIAKALRNQKHEFQNKLHVVLGLIKMKDYEKAENYIMENVYTTNLASDYYSSRIKDDRILALFVGKEIQSKEYNARLMLTSDSYITKSHNPVNSDDIVLVLGNLIDNSFEAYINKDLEHKNVVVDMFEDETKLKLTVIDQAGGIDKEIIDKMFERGISSKNGDSRGTGLSLVSEIVAVYNGEKNVTSTKDETKIEIILKKVIS